MIAALQRLVRRRYIYRDAETGRYVGRLYALLHPRTTVKERVK